MNKILKNIPQGSYVKDLNHELEYNVKSNGEVFEVRLNAAGTKAESTKCGNQLLKY